MKLIDTHTHLYLKEFSGDIKDVIKRAQEEGVVKFFLPAIDSTNTADLLRVESQFPGLHAMMGLHPCSVNNNYKAEMEQVYQWLKKRPFAAVGEIGLDFYWDTTFREQQYIAFRQQIEWALEFDLPIVIHTRDAMQETIDVIKEYSTKGLSGIFHCFSGNLQQAQEIIATGFYLGIGGVLTYKNSGLTEVISHIDMKHLVLETDSPYLTPVPFRGKRNESSYLKYIVQKLAEIKNVESEEVAEVTSQNAEEMFKV